MQSASSLLLSQHSNTCPYIEPDYSTLRSFYFFTILFNTKLHLRIGLPSSLFPSGVITGTRLVFLFITKVSRVRQRATSQKAPQHRQFMSLFAPGSACRDFRPQTTATSFHTPYNLSFTGGYCRSLQWERDWSDVTANCKTQIALRLKQFSFTNKQILPIRDVRQNRMF